MGTVTGYTAEKMDEIASATIVGAHVSGDDLILEKHDGGTINAGSVRGAPGPTGTSPLICTSTTRPTGGTLFDGLLIYETDTKLTYIYNATSTTWINIPVKLLHGFASKIVNTGDDFVISSSSGVDWYSAHPLDVTFIKQFGATQSNIITRITWVSYNAGTGWCNLTAGVRIGATDYWGPVEHGNASDFHAETFDDIVLTGLAAGSITMRARMKKNAAGDNGLIGVGDWFKIEYEESMI